MIPLSKSYWYYFDIVSVHIMYRMQLSVATMNAAKGVVKHILSKASGNVGMLKNLFPKSLQHHLEVLKASVSVLLYTLCKIDILVDQNVLESGEITDAFGMCQVDLRDWVKQNGVIGGAFFGGRIQGTAIEYANAELQVYTIHYTV